MKSLQEHKVEFVIIGTTAFPAHGYARATLDIDIFIKAEMSNAEKTWTALKKFGYDLSDVSVNDLLTKNINSPIRSRDRHPSLCAGGYL